MSLLWIGVLTFVSVSLLVGALAGVVYEKYFYRSELDARLAGLSHDAGDHAQKSPLFMDLKRLNAQTSEKAGDLKVRLREMIEQSGWRMTLRQLLGWSLVSGAALALVLGVIAWKTRWWCGGLGFCLGASLPWLAVVWKRRKRIREMCGQLPEAFSTMSRAVRAGQTIPAAFQIVADDFASPIRDEFNQCYEQQNLGMPYEIALRSLASRTGIMELQILVVALLIQGRSGGNLVELLNNLATMARKRLELRSKVRALTSEGRMQAIVLMVLPLVAFGALFLIAPAYETALLQRPELLAATVGAQLVGALWIRQIVNFDF